MGLQVNGVNVKEVNFNQSSVNYLVKDTKLVWASPKIYLQGPTAYTVVGSPTITDGVISGFASGSYVQTDTNFSFAQPLEIRFTATTSNNVNTSQLFCSVGNGNSNRSFGVTIESGAKMGVAYTTNGASWVGWLPSSYVFEANTRYNFFIDYVPSSYFTIKVKKATESGWTTLTRTLTTPIYTSTNCPFIFGQNYQNKPFLGSIDLNETYIKMNNSVWFGKLHATQDIAPVYSGLTLGSITTTDTGVIDIPSQTFVADSTATWGKDQ